MTRRDKCYLAGVRASRLSSSESAQAWTFLVNELSDLGEHPMPKFKHLFSAIRRATIKARYGSGAIQD